MHEIDVVDHRQRSHPAVEGDEPVGRKEKIRRMTAEKFSYPPLEPDMPEKRVPGLGPDDVGLYIAGEDELPVPGPVKEKEEFMFGMGPGDAEEGLVSEPADTIKFTGEKQTGVDNDLHKKYPLFDRLYYFCVK